VTLIAVREPWRCSIGQTSENDASAPSCIS